MATQQFDKFGKPILTQPNIAPGLNPLGINGATTNNVPSIPQTLAKSQSLVNGAPANQYSGVASPTTAPAVQTMNLSVPSTMTTNSNYAVETPAQQYAKTVPNATNPFAGSPGSLSSDKTKVTDYLNNNADYTIRAIQDLNRNALNFNPGNGNFADKTINVLGGAWQGAKDVATIPFAMVGDNLTESAKFINDNLLTTKFKESLNKPTVTKPVTTPTEQLQASYSNEGRNYGKQTSSEVTKEPVATKGLAGAAQVMQPKPTFDRNQLNINAQNALQGQGTQYSTDTFNRMNEGYQASNQQRMDEVDNQKISLRNALADANSLYSQQMGNLSNSNSIFDIWKTAALAKGAKQRGQQLQAITGGLTADDNKTASQRMADLENQMLGQESTKQGVNTKFAQNIAGENLNAQNKVDLNNQGFDQGIEAQKFNFANNPAMIAQALQNADEGTLTVEQRLARKAGTTALKPEAPIIKEVEDENGKKILVRVNPNTNSLTEMLTPQQQQVRTESQIAKLEARRKKETGFFGGENATSQRTGIEIQDLKNYLLSQNKK